MSENGKALAVVEAPPAVAASVFGTDDTDEIMVRASHVAGAIQALVRTQGFATRISNREFVNVEGWNGLGGLLGLGVRVDFCRPFTDSTGATGYEAGVSIVRGDGSVVGGAQAICTRSERSWRSRDDYAIYSMAQTRATGKAYRSSLSWLMKMAGFEATPAEEMPEPSPAAAPSPVASQISDFNSWASKLTKRDAAAFQSRLREQGVDPADTNSIAEAFGDAIRTRDALDDALSALERPASAPAAEPAAEPVDADFSDVTPLPREESWEARNGLPDPDDDGDVPF